MHQHCIPLYAVHNPIQFQLRSSMLTFMGVARFEIAPCVLARPSQERGQVLRKLLSSQPVESGQPQRVLRWPKVPWTGTGRLSLSRKHQKELQEIPLSLALPGLLDLLSCSLAGATLPNGHHGRVK